MRPLLLLISLVATFCLSLACVVMPTPTPGATPTPGLTPMPGDVAETPEAIDTLATPGAVTPTPQLLEFGGMTYRQYAEPPSMAIDRNASYTATIHTSMGNIVLELFASQAPVTVNNFVFLARQGFYDGVIFHRVIEDFMIQGGDPTGTGFYGPGYTFEDEIVSGLTFGTPGVLAMANEGPQRPNTNGSQFFITVAPTPWLNGNHTIFGRVVEGQGVVDAISEVATGRGDRPLEDVVITRIDISETGGN